VSTIKSPPYGNLTIDGLGVRYGRLAAVSDASLTFEAGKITAIFGPNGAGKSSLLKSIVGLVEPSEGAVVLGDIPVTGRSTEEILRMGVALVPEGKRVFTTLTVEENMRLAAATFKSVGTARINECLALFPSLIARRNQRASSLSGGEQQQLMIARALVGRPKFLLLDEPSLGLSPLVVRDVFEIIGQLAAEGVGVVLVEQYVHKAASVSTRVYVLSKGRIVRDLTGEEARGSISRGELFDVYFDRERSAER
jgi:branched-chain amino acid transport system ATP-binding protein